MREKVTSLVRSGYDLVFCTQDIDADLVEHYFPIIDEWRDFVDPQEIAQQAVSNFAGMEGLFDKDYQQKFVYTALDKLIALTDRGTISRLVYEHFGDTDDYQRFILDGTIDAYHPPQSDANMVLQRLYGNMKKRDSLQITLPIWQKLF